MSAPLPRIGDDGRARGIAAVAALSLGQAAAAGAAAIATRHLFGVLGGRTPTDAPGTDAAPAGAPNALAALAALPAETVALAAVALAGLAIAACRVGERVAAERVGHRYAEALRLALFAHLMRLPVRTLAARRTGSLTLRYTGDLGAIRGWVSLGLARLISAAIVLPGALAAVAWINPALGAAAAASLAAGVAAMAAVAACHAGTHGKARRAQAGLAAHMAERVPQAPVLRLMGRAAVERAALAKRSARMTETALDRARGDALMRAVADVVAGLAAAAVLCLALAGHAGPADTAGALAGLGLAVQPLRDLAGAWGRRRRYLAARARCAALMALSPLPPVRRKRGGAAKPTALAFDGVRAGVLRGLDAAIAPGGRVAVAGPNGAGKTLLLALAAGLEVPERGRVRLDGRPAHRPGPATARPCLIGAHSPILAGTLRRALTMGAASRPGLDDAAIEAAARRYGMDPVLRRLGGLDGCLGEGGRTLSTGERQRLLLARAALSGTGLMLLDKPDEGLDDAAPRLIAMLLAETSATVVMVTHRADVAALADTQWHLERGKLRTPCPAS